MMFLVALSLSAILILRVSIADARGVSYPYDFDLEEPEANFLHSSSRQHYDDHKDDVVHATASKIKSMMQGWQQLSDEERLEFKEYVDSMAKTSTHHNSETDPDLAMEESRNVVPRVFGSIGLYSYYSYLYYYPRMEWSLDRTPETNDYWVGIYKVGASDRKYLTYQWVKKTTQGTYYIGKLSTTAGEESTDRREEYELRIFKGDYQRLDAVSNRLHGVVHSPPIQVPSDARMEERSVDPKLSSFLKSLEKAFQVETNEESAPTKAKIQSLWMEFNPHERDLLYPILEQDCLPSHIKNAEPGYDEWPEPLKAYPNLPDSVSTSAVDPSRIPDKITLTISLERSYTYVYPVVDTTSTLSGKYAWLGVYRARGMLPYPNEGYLGWQWVGPGEEKKTYLSKITEDEDGPINEEYVGPVFDYIGSQYKQIGFGSNVIQATIADTPAAPPPKFDPIFNTKEALAYARLSNLAYKPYDEVVSGVGQYNLKAKQSIYDQGTDTHGFIASNDSTVVVAFRGTKSFTNAVTDLSFIQKKIISTSREYAHGGFVNALNSVYQSIETSIARDLGNKRLVITGHSLGGALASLLTFRLSVKYRNSQPVLYVYGCPPVGDENFSAFFEGKPSYVITIQGDPVSTGTL
uniref:Fungal lipase-type domain-containing protein n=1 Tax=Amphimedon queenslandica TaxID=400682 RepID=A0A1X7TD99_AMPQE